MSRSLILSNPGSVYRGQAYADPEYAPTQNGGPNGIPVLKLPTIQPSGRQSHYDDRNEHQPAEFTLAKFSNADGETLPSQRTTGANSTGGWKTVQMSMQQVEFLRRKVASTLTFFRVLNQHLLIVIRHLISDSIQV